MTVETPAKQHLYLVDGSAYIFRAYHRLPPLTNPLGVPVGAVYGYTTMLWKLADDLNKADGPTHLAVMLDKAGKSFRNDIYPEYKANRPPAPEDLRPQFPLIRDATRAFSLPLIEEDNVEADDMIASYARAAAARGWDVTIVSSDKDLMQLIGTCTDGGGSTDMLDTMKNQRIDVPEVAEKFGVTPDLVGDVLALMGDSADNIPGIRGIGPKTATKLIQDHGNLDAVLAAAPDMKPSKIAGKPDRTGRNGAAEPGAGDLEGRLPAADGAGRIQTGHDSARSAGGVPDRARLQQPAQAAGRRARQP